MEQGKHFKGEVGEIAKHCGVKAKITGISWCSYTKQFLYNIQELESPFYRVQAVGALWGALKKY
tara:strand:- start:737 stop:928 length:192 start_codon:yes stop_codon:yes gene_type:complete